MSNTKAHADNNEQEITLVFSKKKLLGAALSFIAYTAIVVLAVAYATKSDGTSTPNMTSKASSLSSPLSSSMIIDVGGSNTASNTAMANSDGLSTSNQEDTQAKVDTNIVIATTNDLPVSAYTTHSKYSRASSKTSKKAGIDSKSSKGTYSSLTYATTTYSLPFYLTPQLNHPETIDSSHRASLRIGQ